MITLYFTLRDAFPLVHLNDSSEWQGPVDRTGMICPGDELHGVDGIRIHEMTLDEVILLYLCLSAKVIFTISFT